MKKVLAGLLVLGSVSAFSTEITDTEGRYKLVSSEANIGKCADMAVVDLREIYTGDFAAISLQYQATEYTNVMDFTKKTPSKGRNSLKYTYVNNMKEEGKILVKVKTLFNIKLKNSQVYDFSQLDNGGKLFVSELKGKKTLSKCEFSRFSIRTHDND